MRRFHRISWQPMWKIPLARVWTTSNRRSALPSQSQRGKIRVDSGSAADFTCNMKRALTLFLICALSPFSAFGRTDLNEILRKAKEGDPEAQFKIGQEYFRGECKMMVAFQSNLKNAINGNANAQENVASMYRNGDGVSKDLAKAEEWDQKAFQSYLKTAEKGDANAQESIADMYWGGDGVSKDLAKAEEWYQKAFKSYLKVAEKGDANAQYKLTDLYSIQRIIFWEAKAFEWYQKAIESALKDGEAADAEVKFRLALHIGEGLFVSKDPEKAELLFQSAFQSNLKKAERGDAAAQQKLSTMYATGRGTPLDQFKAKYWNQKASESYLIDAEKGDIEAQYELAELSYLKGDYSAQEEWYQKAIESDLKNAKTGDSRAQRRLATIYVRRNPNFPMRHVPMVSDKVEEWIYNAYNSYLKDAANGDFIAQEALGDISFIFSKLRFEYDEKSADWHPNKYKIATELEKTIGLNWIQKAAKNGNPDAVMFLGASFYFGRGMPRDYNKASALLFAAAQKNRRDAPYLLAHMYTLGRGVSKNYVLAWVWYAVTTEFDSENVSRENVIRSGVASATSSRPNVQQKNPLLLKMMSKLEQLMTPEQLAEASELAAEYFDAIRENKPLPTQ